jgi:hypothetical protein
MKRFLIVLIICSLFFVIAWCGIPSVATEGKEDCVCRIMVECYYPGYQPGVDLAFASKIVNSCEEAEKYMQRISQKIQKIGYPDDWEVPTYSGEVFEVFFFLYPA